MGWFPTCRAVVCRAEALGERPLEDAQAPKLWEPPENRWERCNAALRHLRALLLNDMFRL